MSSKEELISTYGNEAKTYFYLRDLGWTHNGACGVMGNINQESGFRTNAVSFDGYGSLGICQWTFGRRTNLENLLKSHSFAVDSLEGQCKFLDYETKTSYPSVYTYLTTEVNLNAAQIARKFCDEWERPAAEYANYTRRETSALTYHTRYNNTYSGSSSSALGIDFNKTVEKLSSSSNFNYIQKEKEEKKSAESIQTLSAQVKDLMINSPATKNVVDSLGLLSILQRIESIVADISIRAVGMNAKFNSLPYVSGSLLPIYPTLIEAPFGEVEIGGVKFGTFSISKQYATYPNYVQSIQINKTNGTINEYTITLLHQISPGDNPNFIAELLSKQGYNEIKISYGDANSGKHFQDIKALVIGVKTSFDFSNMNITYVISATSLSYLTATTKLNFPEVTDKPSNVIFDLLKNQTKMITDYFTGMRDITKVRSAGLIPTNDKVVKIAAVANKTIIDYISYLTALMQNENEKIASKSTYYLSINDNDSLGGTTFNIKEVISDNIKSNSFMYEVDVGYPDKNMIFDFNIRTSYAWAAAYNTALKVVNYKYDIDNIGRINSNRSLSLINETNSESDFQIDENTWKQLTRFPINATLTCKELMVPIPLLNYIRVNNYYFGNKRITSGLYIITEQQDIISSSGCRTILGLTRVASDVDTLSIDGRVNT